MTAVAQRPDFELTPKTLYMCILLLDMGPANERRRYHVTPSLIGQTHTQKDPCIRCLLWEHDLWTNDSFISVITVLHSITSCVMIAETKILSFWRNQVYHYAPFCYRKYTNMCTFLLQNGALWGMGLVHCGVCETGPFSTLAAPDNNFMWIQRGKLRQNDVSVSMVS